MKRRRILVNVDLFVRDRCITSLKIACVLLSRAASCDKFQLSGCARFVSVLAVVAREHPERRPQVLQLCYRSIQKKLRNERCAVSVRRDGIEPQWLTWTSLHRRSHVNSAVSQKCVLHQSVVFRSENRESFRG